MSLRYLIGIDLGTTMAKCVIYDETGDVKADAQKEMVISYPGPGEAEQDARDFYTFTCELIRRCLREGGVDRKGIAAIGIDSQMGGIMTIDKNYEPVTYYDTPLDSRSAEENIWMHDKYGDLILEKNGSISTFGNKILYWKRRDEWKDIYKFIQPSAFVAGKLAGLSGEDAYMDDTFLCFSGFADLNRLEWSPELCDLMEVDHRKLPIIRKPADIIGTVSRKASEDTGLPEGIPIAAGCGDQTAGFVGAGILKTGHMVDVSGTACILGASVDKYIFDEKNRILACVKSALGDNYYLISVVLGGRTHNWFIEEFFKDILTLQEKQGGDIYKYLDDRASFISPGSDGLVSVNYLQGRFFPPDPNVRGLFVGHTWAHTRYHFYRAILESIAYDHYLTKKIISGLVPGINFQSVTAIGSGAKSEFWMQIKSDVLQLKYASLPRSDMSTLGAAIVAGYGAGVFKDIESVTTRFSKPNVIIEPVMGEEKKYKKYIRIYEDLFSALKETYRKLSVEGE
jgi:xylulokinase